MGRGKGALEQATDSSLNLQSVLDNIFELFELKCSVSVHISFIERLVELIEGVKAQFLFELLENKQTSALVSIPELDI